MNIHLASVWMHKWFIHDKNKALFDKLHIEADYILMFKKKYTGYESSLRMIKDVNVYK